MNDPILAQLDRIKLAYTTHRAYFSLAIVNGTFGQKLTALYHIAKASIAEAKIAAFQSDLSATASMLFSLKMRWETPERSEYQQFVKKCVAGLKEPARLEALSKLQPLRAKDFDLDPALLAKIRDSSFHHYLGAILFDAQDLPSVSYENLRNSIEIVKATNANDESSVWASLNLIGRHQAIDLQRTWNQIFIDDKLN